jgi:tRNA dimethylallyltransferase
MNSTGDLAAVKDAGASILDPRSSILPVICGPTAAGKSAVAMWLAKRHDIVIISADSRQVYRGFDIGTSKPSARELKQVPHRGIDIADPSERYSAAAWCAMAREAVLQAPSTKHQAVVVGGTGFYIKALFEPLWEEPELDAGARKAVQAALADVTTDELRRWCTALDPARSHLGRTQLLRAVEISLLTGKRISDLHKTGPTQGHYRARYLVVDPGAELATRIAERTEAMFDAGWVKEVRGLMKSVPADAPAWKASGYETVRAHVSGDLDRRAAQEKIVIETRQYAKRQRTWFRHQLPEESTTRVSPNAAGWEDVVEEWFTRLLDPKS